MWDEVLTHHSPVWREIESQSETYTTRIDYPKNSLSPWITWPTLHRGIDPADHGARFLGQPLGTCNGEPLCHEDETVHIYTFRRLADLRRYLT